MNEQQWLSATDPQQMLEWLRHSEALTERKSRLAAVAFCRRIWGLLIDEGARRAVEAAERFADGSADQAARRAAELEVRIVLDQSIMRSQWDRLNAASAALQAVRYVSREWGYVNIAGYAAEGADGAAALATGAAQGVEHAAQAALLRDLFGPLPFREVRIDPALLHWNGGAMPQLAQAAYEERSLPEGHLSQGRLAVLADALEEAGCADPELLAHLRGPGPHVRGCWALDAVLGRA